MEAGQAGVGLDWEGPLAQAVGFEHHPAVIVMGSHPKF